MKFWRNLFLLGSAAALSACQASYFGVINAVNRSDGVTITTEVHDPRNALSMDIYQHADTPADAPILVFVYGGSWRSGERAWYRFIGESLAAEGVIVVIPDYRKYPDTAFPGFVDDVAVAVRHARDRASVWGGKDIFLAGHSAGAHIALLIASDARYLARQSMQPTDLRGVIGIAGPYDFLPIEGRKLQQVFPDRDNELATQPIAFVDGDEPPTLLLHGSDDGTVWPRNSERMAARLRSKGIETELKMYAGIGHAGIMKALGARYTENAPTRADLLSFIKRHH